MIFDCLFLGPSHQRPSAIVANIMEKLREKTTPRPPTKPKFSTVAKRVLNEKSVLNKLAHPEPSQSVLSPDNRKFLDSQVSALLKKNNLFEQCRNLI